MARELELMELTTESKLILAIAVLSIAIAISLTTRVCSNGSKGVDLTPIVKIGALIVAVGLAVGFGISPTTAWDRILSFEAEHLMQPVSVSSILILGAAVVLPFSFTFEAFRTTRPPSPTLGEPVAAASPLPDAESVLKLIKSRRSIFPKDFNGDAVPREVLARAFEAANWAPTHGKTEPWRFVVFSGRAGLARYEALKEAATRQQLASDPAALDAALAKMAKKSKELANCSAVVGICVKRVKNAAGKMMPEWEESAATACAVQNFHLTLFAHGYHGYWSSGGVGGWADEAAVRTALGMDGECDGQQDKVIGWFHVGASDKAASYRARRGAVEEKVTWIE